MNRRAIPWLFAPLLAGCNPGPIDWQDSVQVTPDPRNHGTLVLDMQGPIRPTVAPDIRPPVAPGQCPASVRLWRDESGNAWVAWWSLRSDQSADLLAASTSNGRTWTTPVRVDTADAGRTGCDRPPPGIMVDGANVHIVYAMRAREGPGIFLAHSMDGGALFHSPVAVVYGEKPGLASVVARGNFVVAAYEDPNTSPTRISVAISTTMAHLFEFRQVVSPPGGAVADPFVWTNGAGVFVSWARAGEPSPTRYARYGTIR